MGERSGAENRPHIAQNFWVPKPLQNLQLWALSALGIIRRFHEEPRLSLAHCGLSICHWRERTNLWLRNHSRCDNYKIYLHLGLFADSTRALSADFRIIGSKDHWIKGSLDQRITGSEDRCIRRSLDQRITGSWDHSGSPNGPRVILTKKQNLNVSRTLNSPRI